MLFLTGCATENKLSLKEKCAGYLTEEKERDFDQGPEWIKYSEKLNTCVSKWSSYRIRTAYYDVLTNEEIKTIYGPAYTQENWDSYEREQSVYESTLRLL